LEDALCIVLGELLRVIYGEAGRHRRNLYCCIIIQSVIL